ncbi:MAG: hypothetical protein JWN86_2623 [Planctomycetota bacterium]|nr:hypothetical protein [Planctomycetota bacterium]
MMALNCVNRFKSAFLNRRPRSKPQTSLHSRVHSVEVLEGRQLMATFAVTNLHDSGPGSLRHAIVASNARPGADTIQVDVTGAFQTGRTALPPITGNVTIADDAGHVVQIKASSRHVVIVNGDSGSGTRYYNSDLVSTQPVSGWQGLRGGDKGQLLISGTSGSNGLLLVGAINGKGKTYTVNVPGATSTSVYGPNNLPGNRIQLVGSYRTSTSATGPVEVNGFVYQGTLAQLKSGGGTYTTIDYAGAKFNYVHSTMGGLAVGNYDGPTSNGLPLGPGNAYIYNVQTAKFVTNITFPGSLSDTAYGIWYNGGTSYTICGGYSPLPVNNLADQGHPLGQAYLVDYDSATGQFSHWTSFSAPSGLLGGNLVTHFEGISSVKNGVYTLSADSVQVGPNGGAQGSVVTVRRNKNGTFGEASWANLNYPGSAGITSSNSVFGNQVVGIVISPTGTFSFQATVKG